ncbi:MAG: M24 family metallopeptidase [Candidatus Doudnabacteria bacterium]|nr:M24 family metallopeptidase [Candidatus Doudnabacteria bacterium]
MYSNRLKNLQKSLSNPILIKKKESLFYLTGRPLALQGDDFLLVTKNNIVAFGGGLEKITWVKKVDRLKNIAQYLKGCKELYIGYDFTYGEGEYLKSKFQISNFKCKILPARSKADEMRQVKELGEIRLVKKSMQIVEKVFILVKREIVKPGMTEIKLAHFIKNAGLRLGAESVSFPPIVASGVNAAIPHHVPDNKELKAGETIILDFGFKYKNYCSDFTRTVFIKKANRKMEEAYNQVERAYSESIRYIDRGMSQGGGKTHIVTGDRVYKKSVEILAEKKLDQFFIHSLGHGTGLEIHELPNLSPNSKDLLENGMVFSIEPGVYMPKKGGVRIEDLVYLENNKVNKFIQVPTEIKYNIL